MSFAASFIASKFVENTSAALLPVDFVMQQEVDPMRKSLSALTPSPRVSRDGDSASQGVTLSPLPTHKEVEELMPEKGDVTSSVSYPSGQSMDRLALLSILKSQDPVKPDSHANTAETKRAYNRMFFTSPCEGRTESDLHAFDENLFSTSEACQPLTRGARFAIAKTAGLRSVPAGRMIFRPGDEQGAVFWVINGSLEVESPDGAIRVIQEGSSLGSFPRPPSFDPSTPRTRQPMHLSPTPAPKWTETCRATNLTDLVLLTLAQWEVILQSDPYCFVSKVSSFLEDLPMFSILSQAQIDILSKIARYQVFESGQIVFQQGSEGEDVYLIKTGFVRVLRDTRLEESDRNRLNHVARDNQNLDEDIAHVVTPRFAGDRPKCKAPPSFLERIPPSPMTGSGHLYSDATGSEVSPLNKKRGLGGVGATSTSDKLSSRVRQMEIRSLTGVGALSTKRLGGGLTPRATEQGDKEVAGSSTISLPPLDLTRLKKPPQLIASQELNRINNSTLYSPRSPRKLDSSPSVLIELANLGSGHIFGDIRSNSLHALITQSKMTSSPQPTPTRPFSAVCDTRVETFEIRKIDALSKIGPDIEFLWLPDGGEATSARPSAAPERSKGVGKSKALQLSTMESMGRGSFITPVVRQTKVDVKILEDVERKMKWENYKKKILLMVYEDI